MILSLSENADNGMMMVLLVLCAIVIMVVLLRRHQFRSTSGRDMAREQIARIRDQHKLRHSMDELLVQLEEVSRRVGAQVDTKFAKLEKVIRDADDRIARLEHVLGRAGGEPTQQPAKPPPVEPVDTRFQQVYDLVDAGASPIKAAEQLDLPLGEVELIMNLRKLR